MTTTLFEQLHQQGLVSDESKARMEAFHSQPKVSLHLDLKILLYAGVLLLSGGLGILVYKNIDTIGHQVILALIAAACVACYYYCYKRRGAFSWQKVESPDILYDYILLLGSLLLLTFIGYLQYQYEVFGHRWNLATFIPMVLLFITAYYFDHQGVLSLAITNLAAWLGVVINEKGWYSTGKLNEDPTIYTAIALGAFLIGIAYLTVTVNRKAHFKSIYHQFGTHLFFIGTLTAMFHFDNNYWPWFGLLIAGGVFHYLKAIREKSFYYLLITVFYLYIGVSFVMVDLISKLKNSEIDQELGQIILAYFIISAIGTAIFMISMNKKIKQDAGL